MSRRMEAKGVLSSWEASDTNRRRSSSVTCKRPVSWLNSSASWASSSCPGREMRWVYSPARTVRMPPSRARTRREREAEKAPKSTSPAKHTTAEISRRLRWSSTSRAPWLLSSS